MRKYGNEYVRHITSCISLKGHFGPLSTDLAFFAHKKEHFGDNTEELWLLLPLFHDHAVSILDAKAEVALIVRQSWPSQRRVVFDWEKKSLNDLKIIWPKDHNMLRPNRVKHKQETDRIEGKGYCLGDELSLKAAL